MPSAYDIRSGGNPHNKRQNMAELKLRRLNELNVRLKEDLERPRIKVSEASMRYVRSLPFWSLAERQQQQQALRANANRLSICIAAAS
jgi:hypothetical protein